eukprot:Cvel_29583.t1-p1 / transcript=Cvel_29583.t1 / gene=Cvel_29583 / organism=Chromera_velia_CCMP2878 / gene_product=hypothetical protein / transcript_product=hypothetical protein / location=Cvel_scaffold4072:2766-3268(-) / protein_length=100 / sequence_SO=supercontig / SO=protein_coding / is_pseudo=false
MVLKFLEFAKLVEIRRIINNNKLAEKCLEDLEKIIGRGKEMEKDKISDQKEVKNKIQRLDMATEIVIASIVYPQKLAEEYLEDLHKIAKNMDEQQERQLE